MMHIFSNWKLKWGIGTKKFVFFFTHEPSFYRYFHVLTSSHANPSFGALNYQIHHRKMKYQLRCMISFTLERWILCTYVAITCNNDVVWSMSWTHFLWFHWWFLALCTHLNKHFFLWKWMNLKVGCDFFLFPHWRKYHLVS